MKGAGERQALLLRGIGVGERRVSGTVAQLRPRVGEQTSHVFRGAEAERERLTEALARVAERLEELEREAERVAGAEAGEIFAVHRMLLEDEDLHECLLAAVARGCCAEEAVESACEQYAALLAALPDPYLSARAADLRDLSRQLTEAMRTEEERTVTRTEPHILVAEDLCPSEAVGLDATQILGIVTAQGSPNSHTAILARAMGIPALVGVGSVEGICDGAMALLDPCEGTLVLFPDERELADFRRRVEAERGEGEAHERYLRSLLGRPARTRRGHQILIYANVGGKEEALLAARGGAEGIGLLRSEMLYLSLDHFPEEEGLCRAYCEVAACMRGKRIVIRTLDVGADKQRPHFGIPREENPAMGLRGVRYALANRPVFKTQLRAILRASAMGSVALMIPMVVSVEEVRSVKALLEECKEELTGEGVAYDAAAELGIMLETPAAAMMCEELAREVDFFSVGTNDLLQYTLAADRQNPHVQGLCEKNHEPVLRMIAMAANAIHRHGGWIGVCGELAADLSLTQRFADLLVDELSVSPPYLLGVRERVIECQ